MIRNKITKFFFKMFGYYLILVGIICLQSITMGKFNDITVNCHGKFYSHRKRRGKFYAHLFANEHSLEFLSQK